MARLCASRHAGEDRLAAEACAPACTNTSCTACRCRACAACRCTDLTGARLVEPLCSYAFDFREDSPLPPAKDARACERACSSATHLRSSCVAWTYSRYDRQCVGHSKYPHFVTGWEPEGIDHGVASCSAQVWPQLLTAEPLILLITIGSFACHGPSLDRLARAREQLTATARHFFRVLHVSRDEGGNHEKEDANASAALEVSVGRDVVDRIGLPEIKRVFPNILHQMRKVKWMDRRKPLWLSNGCDLPLLAWHALKAHRLPRGAKHLWVLQHDVGWTHALPAVLLNLGAAPELHGADLICDEPSRMPADWFHFNERWPLDLEAPVYSCLLPVQRISVRLVQRLTELVAAGNSTAYCEIRAPSTCASISWCSMASIRVGASSALGPFSHFTKIEERLLRQAETSHVLLRGPKDNVDANCVGRLVHQVI
ncbi:hypothetical protein AB1Y20_014412 [Prymnesium parvum]|uniref:Protein xylosyltransferase n=1 Tax=Prymnesium parvum TaxID=97485 RepID=A0AB34IDY1_PRYPA